MRTFRSFLFKPLIYFRKNLFLRKKSIAVLVWLDNFCYWAISFLSSCSGVHPKHEIVAHHDFFLKNTNPEDKILDIGCGRGFITYKLAQKAKKVVGIDIKEKNIKEAKKLHSSANLSFIIGDATCFPLEEKFDAIILSNVLEHIKDRISFLIKIKEIAPKILIRVPLITRDWLAVYKKNHGYSYLLDPTHFIEYTEEEFEKEMQKAGLEISSYYIKFGELYSVCVTKND